MRGGATGVNEEEEDEVERIENGGECVSVYVCVCEREREREREREVQSDACQVQLFRGGASPRFSEHHLGVVVRVASAMAGTEAPGVCWYF